MKSPENNISTSEISQDEIFRKLAIARLNEEIAKARMRLKETDLSDDYVLIPKLNTQGLGEQIKKIEICENELKELENGILNPEYVLFEHSDNQGKLQLMSEKVDPESELGKIFSSKKEIEILPESEKEYIKNFSAGLNRLRNIAELESLGGDESMRVYSEHLKETLTLELKQKESEFFVSENDHQKVDELKRLCSVYEKYLCLADMVEKGRVFSKSETIKLQFEHPQTKQVRPTWYGEMNNLFKEFRLTEQKYFPRDLNKIKEEEISTPANDRLDIAKVEKKDAENLKKARQSLGLGKSDEKEGKLFVSPELLKGYKTSIDQFSDYFGRLNRILYNRNEDGFSELIDDNSFARIKSTMRSLREFEIKKETDFETLSNLFSRLSEDFETIGTIRSRTIKDSVDSLKIVANSLMLMGEIAQDIARQLNTTAIPEALQTSKRVARLVGTLFDRRMATLRRMDKVGDYSGR